MSRDALVVREQWTVDAGGIESWFEKRADGRFAVARHHCRDIPDANGRHLGASVQVYPFDDEQRTAMARRHAVEEVRYSLERLRQFGFAIYLAAVAAEQS